MPDQYLWTASLGDKEIRASVRKIHVRQDSSDLFGVELRITKNGDLYFSQVFGDLKALHEKSMELVGKLAEKGWIGARPREN